MKDLPRSTMDNVGPEVRVNDTVEPSLPDELGERLKGGPALRDPPGAPTELAPPLASTWT